MFTGRQTKKGRREDWDTLGARHIIETLERDAPRLLNTIADVMPERAWQMPAVLRRRSALVR